MIKNKTKENRSGDEVDEVINIASQKRTMSYHPSEAEKR
jgi:hypothetical protein